MSELLPCPFCGGKPTAIETHPGRGELYCGKCDLVMCGDNAKTPEELTQAWNTRHVETCRMIYDEEASGDELWPTEAFHCSECGKWVYAGKPNYCPNCGRKVEG